MSAPWAPAPICLFAYRRPRHTARTLAALAANPLAAGSDLYCFADGAKGPADRDGVAEVRDLLRGTQGFRRVEVLERPTNLGLADNVIDGVTRTIRARGRVIVCEDDLEISPHFLAFMNRALATYADDPRVFSITGYGYAPGALEIPADYPHAVYLSHRGGSIAWGTWEDRWAGVDWALPDYPRLARDRALMRRFAEGGADLPGMLAAQRRGEIDSWAVRFAFARARRGAYALVPVRSYVDTSGDDGSGTHGAGGYTRRRNDLGLALADPGLPLGLVPDERILAGIRRIFAPSWRVRLGRRLRGLVPPRATPRPPR